MKWLTSSPFSRKFAASLSENLRYPQFCVQAATDYRVFGHFRRNPVYNEILEHVSAQQGEAYLREIVKTPDLLASIGEFKNNDLFGSPRTFEYPSVGAISPSTLRYIKVLSDLRRLFHSLDDFDVCEIGVGYGGQCRIINAFFHVNSYLLVDIQPVLMLARRYLENYVMKSWLSYKTMNELPKSSFDLVISNYAFSELSRNVQDVYLDKIIMNSTRGYLTYNEITPPEYRSYGKDDLLATIPGSRVIDEVPLTHSRNCIILWGSDLYLSRLGEATR